MEKIKFKYWITYIVTSIFIYLNGAFVNATFDIHKWPHESRQCYGLAFFFTSLVLGMVMFISMIDIREEAKKIIEEDEE
jgi:hypothetical protein